VVGWTDVDGFSFPSLIRSGRMLGTQFHPEKSGPTGRALLAAWVQGLLDAAPAGEQGQGARAWS
jgi:imidazoleglycerol phosphate synthase glutamine amidotransferase subunit HisH